MRPVKKSPEEERHQRGADLIRQAFERARHSGVPEWQKMKTSVLKNRLLDLTDRKFSEAEWGANSFRQFVAKFDDVIEIVSGERPTAVRLLSAPGADGETAARPPDPGPRLRIRKDLWDAVLDYSSGARYVWDGERAVAVPEGETVEDESSRLPTVSENEFREWRSEFVSEKSRDDSSVASFLYVWLEKEQPLAALPSPLRVAWVIELKQRVIERLQSWFRERELPPPPDLLIENVAPRDEKTDVEALREVALAAVRGMSRTELEALQIPATVLLRGKD